MMAVILTGFAALTLFAIAFMSERKPAKIATGVVGSVLALACVFVVVSEHVLGNRTDEVWETDRSTSLASMANASEVEGQSSAFVTRIEEKNVFRYVEARSDGGFELKEIDADGVAIYEDADKDSARIDFQSCHREGLDEESLSYRCGERVRVHVPKGTVSTDFEIDPGKGDG